MTFVIYFQLSNKIHRDSHKKTALFVKDLDETMPSVTMPALSEILNLINTKRRSLRLYYYAGLYCAPLSPFPHRVPVPPLSP